MIETLAIKTKYPCCGRPARFVAVVSIPAERYTRRCRPCETVWDIERRKVIERGAIRMDRLDWEDTQTGEYVKTYGG